MRRGYAIMLVMSFGFLLFKCFTYICNNYDWCGCFLSVYEERKSGSCIYDKIRKCPLQPGPGLSKYTEVQTVNGCEQTPKNTKTVSLST